MLPLSLPSQGFRPLRYRPDGVGYWSGHIPFACDLVQSLKPSVLVELGTYYGESYFAFCQAVDEEKISCACYAVDSWKGDPHIGSYGEEVFKDVEAYNARLYRPFSSLLRQDFDVALRRFEPESIDLLHIDGFHSYEAVRHDFEAWLSRVRPGGIVLLHDIAVRQPDFGVWRLWDELETRFRTFAFHHSQGLGVLLKPGGSAEVGVAALLFGESVVPPDTIRAYYELCAERLELRHKAELAEGGQELSTCLYWRASNEAFSDVRSARVFHTVGARESVIRLHIPPRPAPTVELRLDLSDRPAVLRLTAVSFLDAGGQTLCVLPAATLASGRRSREMAFLKVGGTDILAVMRGESSVLLSADSEHLQLPLGAVIVEVGMCGVDPLAELGKLAPLLQTSTGDLGSLGTQMALKDEELCRCEKGLAEAQRLVAEREAELRRYDEALGTAQRLVAEREAEVRRYDEALGTAQRLVAERDAELRRCDEALGTAHRIVVERDEQLQRDKMALDKLERRVSEQDRAIGDALADLRSTTSQSKQIEASRDKLARQLAAIQESFVWRLARPLRWIERITRRPDRNRGATDEP